MAQLRPNAIHVTIEGPTAEEEAKAFMRGLRKGGKAASKWWRDKIAPLHFKTSAMTKYEYQPRTLSYQKRWHTTRPLVRSGKTEKMVTQNAKEPRIKTAGKGFIVKLTIDAPKYFFAIRSGPKGGVSPDMVDELLRRTDAEREHITQMILDGGNEAVARFSKRRRKVA